MLRKKTLGLFGTLLLLLVPCLIAAEGGSPSYQDAYNRGDVPPPGDSLGATEVGRGQTALDYREIDVAAGIPAAADVARIESGALVVLGAPQTTRAAFAELASTGRDLEIVVSAEFLADNPDILAAANTLSIVMRNDGTAPNGTFLTAGMVVFDLRVDGYFEVRTVDAAGTEPVVAFLGYVDWWLADRDGDDLLDAGDVFALRLRLEGSRLSFDFQGASVLADRLLVGLPDPAGPGAALMLGRGQIAPDLPDAFTVRFDDLQIWRLGEADADDDGDGFPAPEDCDDANPSVHPGAAEQCNGLDDNCDGAVDEGVTSTFYRDADGDGYGNAGVPTNACTQPSGYVVDASDCDDGNANVHPFAAETCNGVDDDCDGAIDEGLSGTYYPDADRDGYGASSGGIQSCGAPDGYVADNTDCDDGDPLAHPGAVDIPGNAVDENCDGAAVCDPDAAWKNHGQYVACVTHEVARLAVSRKVTFEQAKSIIASAARSDVGKKKRS